LKDVFKNADITFRTNKFPKGFFKEVPKELNSLLETKKEVRSTQKRGLWEILVSIWQGIEKFSAVIEAIVEGLPSLIR
jgi:hypothetical protein